VVKAKCGADVVVQLFQGNDPQPLQQAGVQVKVGAPPQATGLVTAVTPGKQQYCMLDVQPAHMYSTYTPLAKFHPWP
jgi:hypothetical protein